MTRIILRNPTKCFSGLAVALTLSSVTLAQEQIDGSWRNSSSTFQLDIVTSGSLVCGNYNASSGDKVDFSALVGSRTGKTTHVFFRNGFTDADSKSLGDALLFIERGMLKWRLQHAPSGVNYVWEKSDLRRSKANLALKDAQSMWGWCRYPTHPAVVQTRVFP